MRAQLLNILENYSKYLDLAQKIQPSNAPADGTTTPSNGSFSQALQNSQKEFEAAQKKLDELKAQSASLDASLSKIQEAAKKDAEMFKIFDFQQILNKLMFSNLTEKERQKAYEDLRKIASSV